MTTKKITNILASLVVVTFLASCSVTLPYAVTDHPIGTQKGVSKTNVLFGSIYLNKNFGIVEAAKKGKIKGPISTVDYKITYYLGPIFYTRELLVTGDAE